MKNSLVITTRNRKDVLSPLLEKLEGQTGLDEVVVVDDASTDGTKQMLRQARLSYSWEYVRLARRVGTPAARNVGIEKSAYGIVGFTDDDCLPLTDRWVEAAGRWVDKPGVAACGGPIYFRSDSPGAAGKTVGRIQWVPPEVIGNWDSPGPSVRLVDTLPGGNMFFDKQALMRAGGFDPEFDGNHYREETDACMRVRQYGKLVYDQSIPVNHLRVDEGGCRVSAPQWYAGRATNTFLLIAKNWPASKKAAGLLSYSWSKLREIVDEQEDQRYYSLPRPALYASLAKGFLHGLRKTARMCAHRLARDSSNGLQEAGYDNAGPERHGRPLMNPDDVEQKAGIPAPFVPAVKGRLDWNA